MDGSDYLSSPSIERSVIGTFLRSPTAYGKHGHTVSPDYFLLNAHKRLFEAMYRGIRTPRLIAEFAPDLRPVIAEIVAMSDISAEIEEEIAILADKYHRRRLIDISRRATDYAQNDREASAADIIDRIVSEIAEQPVSTGRPEHIRDILPRVMESLRQRMGMPSEISTGLQTIDEKFGGFEPKEVTIIAARPSMGKTSFILQIIRNIAYRKNLPVLVFSLEMGREQIAGRILFSESKTSYGEALLGKKQAIESVGSNMSRVASAGIYIDDTPGQTVAAIAAKSEYYVKTFGIRAIFVDHLGFVKNHRAGRSRHEELSEISKGFVAIAKKLNIPVILVSQLSREVERRKPPIPMLSDLRESGSLEEDARKVILLYREDYYKIDSLSPNIVEVVIAKNHNGQTGAIQLFGRKETMSYECLEHM